MQLVIALSLALCVLGLAENFLHRRNLQKISIRIMINGTRGKSSVTRLIAGALREAGYATIAKTTGSEASVILEDGSETLVRRPFGPKITEQKALARMAARRGAQAIVVECMAVRPESQRVMQTHLVRATIGVITNVRVDHIDEMGKGISETAAALASTIPVNGTLVTTDSRFAKSASRVIIADASLVTDEILARFPYPLFAENIALALAVTSELGIGRETALSGMAKARPDIGVLRIFSIKRPVFSATVINGFAANDVVSTKMIWDKISPRLPPGAPLALLYNNRADREFRIGEFVKLAGGLPGLRLVVVSGDHATKVAKLFAKPGLATLALGQGLAPDILLESIGKKLGDTGSSGDFVVFGVGNIQGTGKNLVSWCMEEECFRNR